MRLTRWVRRPPPMHRIRVEMRDLLNPMTCRAALAIDARWPEAQWTTTGLSVAIGCCFEHQFHA